MDMPAEEVCRTARLPPGFELQVFADSAKEVELFLLNNGVDFDSRDPRRPDRNSRGATSLA